jgi:hypothetical protein
MKTNKLITLIVGFSLPFTHVTFAQNSTQEPMSSTPTQMDTLPQITAPSQDENAEATENSIILPEEEDTAPLQEEPKEMPIPEEATQDSSQPREVGAASFNSVETAKTKQLGNFAIAALTIIVAVTAVVLVSRHPGKRK